jgi:hypothetical protein
VPINGIANVKIFFWLITVVASCAVGFYFGVGYGAKTLGAIVAQNEVTDGLARVRVSLDALEHSDLTHANKLHEQNLKSALFQIGSYSQSLAYWACTDKDRETIQAAHKYTKANPGLLDGQWQQFETRGLAFCAAKGSGQPISGQ